MSNIKKTSILSVMSILIGFVCSCQVNHTELIADFETENMEGWTSTGDLSLKPYKTERLPAAVAGFIGAGVLNTGHDQPGNTGKITSPEFIISKKYINFLITGHGSYNSEKGDHVRLIVKGKIVKYAPATRYPLVEWGAMDVGEFIGQTASFEISDNSKKGCIIVDNIYQSNELALGKNQRSMVATEQYILFPVTKGSTQYRIRLEKEGDVTEQFVIEMGEGEPDYWAFKDIGRYKGKKIKLSAYCPAAVSGFDKIKQSSEIRGEASFYQEKERPQFHFTSKTGHINDPNGLVYYQGEWHLMYQHNPYGVIGSLKHWGHAVSTDLIHWKERPSSVVPDDLGSNHSGGAVVDFNNSAGLQTGKDKTLIAFWTSAGHFSTPSSHFRQCFSYSTDKGITWNKYEHNPVIGFIQGRNRDPNVIWHEKTKKWIMALYLDGNKYAILNSVNLIDWTLTTTIKMPASECPDMFQLNLDDDPLKTKWIFWGGNGNYVTGDFDGEKFTIEGEAHKTHFGQYYAAMTFNDAPQNRMVQVGWLNKWPFPDTNFKMQLSISNEITLKTSPEGYPALYAYPVKEIETLRIDSLIKSNISIAKESFMPGFEAELIDMKIIARVKDGAVLNMKIRGQEVVYNRDENSITCEGTKVILLTRGEIQEFRILVDRASVEIFCNKGEKALFIPAALDPTNRKLEFSTSGGKVEIKQFAVYSLKSSWEK
jgi:sucrose-6-phosphate hydrolase SacC (GH32 family)